MIRQKCGKADKGKNCATCKRWTGRGPGQIVCSSDNLSCYAIYEFSFFLWLKAFCHIKTKKKHGRYKGINIF